MGAFVLGVEADLDWTNLKGNGSPATCPGLSRICFARLQYGEYAGNQKSDHRIRMEERKKWKQIAMAGKSRARP